MAMTPGTVCKLRVTGYQFKGAWPEGRYTRRLLVRSEEPDTYSDRLPPVRPERLERVQ